jgi:pyruvate/2-oxoglutarate dehydrogenase complex dihydrolipoamide dehydrogenase (E3) component
MKHSHELILIGGGVGGLIIASVAGKLGLDPLWKSNIVSGSFRIGLNERGRGW